MDLADKTLGRQISEMCSLKVGSKRWGHQTAASHGGVRQTHGTIETGSLPVLNGDA